MKVATQIGVVLLMSVMLACKSKEVILTSKQIKEKTDSLVALKKEELHKQAAEDLEKRQAIEVKAKADSIVEAYVLKQPLVANDSQ